MPYKDPEKARISARSRALKYRRSEKGSAKHRAYADSYRKTHVEERRKNARVNKLRREYGMSPEDYDRMVVAQNGVCAICRRPPPSGSLLVVDHCHQTKRVRGLLCQRCNTGIGMLDDDSLIVHAAADYLDRAGASGNTTRRQS